MKFLCVSVTNVDHCATWAVFPGRCLASRVAGVHDFQRSDPFCWFPEAQHPRKSTHTER